MKIILFIFLSSFFISICSAQKVDSSSTIPINNEVAILIKGQGYKTILPLSAFNNNLVLEVSDTSYSIEGFHVSWMNEGEITEVRVKGNTLQKRGSFWDLSKIEIDMDVLIDHITFSKNGKYFQAFPLYIRTKDFTTQNGINTNVGQTIAFLSGEKNSRTILVSKFTTDQEIHLLDSSYQIIGFDILVAPPYYNTQDIILTFTGNKIPRNTKFSKEYFVPNAILFFQNIKAVKNNQTYQIRPFDLTLKN